ncbi:RluA family pseudouridine synthase [Paenibacillus sp. GP183]|jgi:23S rRNA pseudouridine1911/1915/1917 synthase|uniref:RluA family pseudouridine synthase n=1 Tax=Paenibacillus sp. GP183 TaxID=1882751 RepID=UPI0008995517|nr:RluA family pseudouridine synthase [Paenibacillus sp. GP183]SEC72023.1 23S rRNA pseudouridine1911/1915/1917 synthase [Paenibacillus sp. GP183]
MIRWKRKGEWMELALYHSDWNPVQQDAAQALEQHLNLRVPRKLFNKLLKDGGIKRQGDRLLVRVFPSERSAIASEYSELEILFEDDFCLVVNKPAGMSIHPAEKGQKGTLAGAVAYYYESTGQSCSIRHIHRLDRDTTGAVLYAKNEWAHLLLDEDMREKHIERIYTALASGIFTAKEGSIREPIGSDRHLSGKRRVTPDGDDALTHFTVLEQMKKAAHLQIRLETGRTHQIRVHMSYIGHPLLGDILYGGTSIGIDRQALHGEQLLFSHPVSGEPLSITAPLPDDFLQLQAKLRE